jgi:hypothetical protein
VTGVGRKQNDCFRKARGKADIGSRIPSILSAMCVEGDPPSAPEPERAVAGGHKIRMFGRGRNGSLGASITLTSSHMRSHTSATDRCLKRVVPRQ